MRAHHLGRVARLTLGIGTAWSLPWVAQSASAQDNGPTIVPSACMQRVFIGPEGDVTNANALNCTANDIRLSRAIRVSPERCIADTTFTLEGTFETIVTANARYDSGFFFRIDGGQNARGDGAEAAGECSLSALDPAIAPALELDGDTCGDLNAGTYELTFTIPNVLCSDTNGDGFVNLPNCTSWHSNQRTACDIDDELGFHPDTKSKCVCDDDFQVPVIVELPSGVVEKTATQALVTYEVKVKNNSETRTVRILSLVDDIYGDIADDDNDDIQSTTCDDRIGNEIAPGATSNACEFTVLYPAPGTAGDLSNTVTAGVRDTGNDNDSEFDGSTTINVDLNIAP